MSANLKKKRHRSSRKALSDGKISAWLRGMFFVTAGAAVILALVVTCIFAYYKIVHSPVFAIKEIKILGTKRVSEQRIMEITGLKKGVNLFSVNLSAARKRLIAEPWIRSAGIERRPPSTVIIRIREYIPVAVLDFGEKFLIDSRGEIFMPLSPGAAESLPLIKGIDYTGWMNPNGDLSRPASEVLVLLDYCFQPDSSMPAGVLESIYLDQDAGITLFSKTRFESVFVGFGSYQEKLANLKYLEEYMDSNPGIKSFSWVDLSQHGRVTARPEIRKSINS